MGEAGRPKKVRYIQKMPKVMQFSPRGRPGRPEEIEVTLDQFEALKLADFQGFSQSDGAKAMRISRPSFGRILRQARFMLADAIVNGKIIKIVFGDVQVGVRKTELSRETLQAELGKFEQRHKEVVESLAGLGRRFIQRQSSIALDGYSDEAAADRRNQKVLPRIQASPTK